MFERVSKIKAIELLVKEAVIISLERAKLRSVLVQKENKDTASSIFQKELFCLEAELYWFEFQDIYMQASSERIQTILSS